MWLKFYHPVAFYCALLNQQPMGFYSPEVVVNDAKRHRVQTLPPDINQSGWEYGLERTEKGRWALQAGLKIVKGMEPGAWEAIRIAGEKKKFAGLRDFCQRARLAEDVVQNLIRAGALDSFGERRELLWELGQIAPTLRDTMKLEEDVLPVALPKLKALEQTLWNYTVTGITPDVHILEHYRPKLRKAGIASTWEVKQAKAGQHMTVAGMIVVRQMPGTAKGATLLLARR